jgi:hypothetical protein
MFRIHECGRASSGLGLGDHLQRQRGLARRLWAEDFHHAAARKSADAQRRIDRYRAARNHGHRQRVARA